MASIDLSEIGALQATALHRLQQPICLPANAAQFPLGVGQFYGQVATNCRLANAKAGSNKGLTTRNHHRARGAITEIAMVLPNWYVERSASKFEYPNNAGTICAASIEYPAGVFHRLIFDGAVRDIIPGGRYLVSAFCSISIPDNAEFWTNIWVSAASTVVFFNGATGQVSANGERGTVSTGDVTDFTMTSHSGTAQTYGLWPLSLIGRTSSKAIALIGDSISEGIGDIADVSDYVGLLARLVGSTCPYMNLSQSGDRLEFILQGSTKRFSTLAYVRNVVFGLGVNDVSSGRSLTQIKTDMIAVWSKAKGMILSGGRVFQSTITPSCTSTDSFSTLANQTPTANFAVSGTGTRELLNDWLRDGAPMGANGAAPIGSTSATRAGNSQHPLHEVWDLADAVESARNSGRWKVDGTPFKWTGDGLHPSDYAYLQTGSSGISVSGLK